MSNEGALVSLANQNKALSVGAEAAVARAVAEVQARLVIGQQFPRNEKQAIQRIVNACTRPRLAEAATYEYVRGNTRIYAASIRLAETVAQHWGNVDFGWREVEQKDGVSTCEAFAHDVQTNTRRVMEFKVPLTRYTKAGMKRLTDPRDIYEMVANQASRRVRACILAVIPGDVIDDAIEQCEQTLRCNEDVTPDGIQKMIKSFAELGVTKAMIAARIQRDVETITPALKVNLRKIFNAIKDGIGKPEDYFELETVEDKKKPASKPKKPKMPPKGDKAPPKEESTTEEPDKSKLLNEIDAILGELTEEDLDHWMKKIGESFGTTGYINFDEPTLEDLKDFLSPLKSE